MGVFDAEPLSDDGGCFACGKTNPRGLGMVVEYEGDEVVCRINLPAEYQGWPGIAHGGIVAVLLDEIMAHALIHAKRHGITTKMETIYRAPVHLGRDLEVRGRVANLRSRMAVVEGFVSEAESGKLLAQSKADFLLRRGAEER